MSVCSQEMDKRFHNGQGFLYKVSWREAAGTSVHWNSADVQSPPFLVNNTGTYTPFEIKVQAVNALGAGPAAEPEIGHSGEDSTLSSPSSSVQTIIINDRSGDQCRFKVKIENEKNTTK